MLSLPVPCLAFDASKFRTSCDDSSFCSSLRATGARSPTFEVLPRLSTESVQQDQQGVRVTLW